MKFDRPYARAFSLVELLVVISIIGILTALVIPAISDLSESGQKSKNMANAKHIERMSASLATLGVAHVIPDSMGGVEATARLLREGVTVPEGPMKDQTFQLPSLSDDDITDAGKLLRVQYDMEALRLVMDSNRALYFSVPSACLYCYNLQRSPVRIEELDLV